MARRREYKPDGQAPTPRVGEARLAYLLTEAGDDLDDGSGETRLSGKNQLTIPAAMCRALGWRPGDALGLTLQGDSILLDKLPQTPEEWARRIRGPLAQVGEWANDEKIDAWVRTERESWEQEREWDR